MPLLRFPSRGVASIRCSTIRIAWSGAKSVSPSSLPNWRWMLNIKWKIFTQKSFLFVYFILLYWLYYTFSHYLEQFVIQQSHDIHMYSNIVHPNIIPAAQSQFVCQLISVCSYFIHWSLHFVMLSLMPTGKYYTVAIKPFLPIYYVSSGM